jgi:hypothetical protein
VRVDNGDHYRQHDERVERKASPTAGTGWRKLEEAQRRYAADPNAENRAEFRRLLRLFANLVMRGQTPPPVE